MAKGIIRTYDAQGRVSLPKEMCESLDLAAGDHVDIYVEGDVICLAPATAKCAICGGRKSLMPLAGRHICRECAIAAGRRAFADG